MKAIEPTDVEDDRGLLRAGDVLHSIAGHDAGSISYADATTLIKAAQEVLWELV